MIRDIPPYPANAQSVYPFEGGETNAKLRLHSLLSSNFLTAYPNTYNGLLGIDSSSKLSAYLALGCITPRQINAYLGEFEDGVSTAEDWKSAPGFGGGENGGTTRMRVELLWRDYTRQCTRKFGPRLFSLSGFKQVEGVEHKWTRPDKLLDGQNKEQVTEMLERFLNGTTGIGLIDASQREIFLTGYTSNRARLNTASFLVNYLCIDWRLGAEWYECLLVDYDVSSNWGNWQYTAGVGSDPRGGRILNPVKQALDYDPKGEYIKTWVPETRDLTKLAEIFQPWTCQDETLKKETGLQGLNWVEEPLKKIHFTFGQKHIRLEGSERPRGLGKLRGRGSGESRGKGFGRPRRLGKLRGRGSGESRGKGYEGSRGLGGLSGSPNACESEKEDGNVEAKGSSGSENKDGEGRGRRHSYS
jgi:deoxyribodipyrimidine photo-lyase